MGLGWPSPSLLAQESHSTPEARHRQAKLIEFRIGLAGSAYARSGWRTAIKSLSVQSVIQVISIRRFALNTSTSGRRSSIWLFAKEWPDLDLPRGGHAGAS